MEQEWNMVKIVIYQGERMEHREHGIFSYLMPNT